jgi:multiple sugar transport system substrate-binding protein
MRAGGSNRPFRNWLIRMAAVGLTVVVAACGTATTSSDAPASQPAQSAPAASSPAGSAPASSGASGDVTFWDMIWGPTVYIDTAKATSEGYSTVNPAVKVTYQSQPWTSWPQVFTTAVAAGSPPDVSTGGGYQAIQYYAQDAILPLTDLANEFGADAFADGQLEALNYEGEYVAIPWAIDMRVPWYRKDLLATDGVAAPTNWDELKAACPKLTHGEQYCLGFSAGDPSGWQQLWSLVLNNGGGLFNAEGKLDVMNPRNVEALTFVSDLIKAGHVHPGSAGWTMAQGMAGAMSNGEVAIAWTQPAWNAQVDPSVKDQTVLMSPLTGPNGDKGTLVFGNNIMAYSATKSPDATKEFIRWWSENQLPVFTTGQAGGLPARKSVADAYVSDPGTNEYTRQVYDEWVPVGKLTGANAPGTFPALADIDSGGMMQTLATDILQGMAPTEALQKLDATLKSLPSLAGTF